MRNRFIYLKNVPGQKIGFNRQRNVTVRDDDENTKIISDERKGYFRIYRDNFIQDRHRRIARRTLKLTAHIDLIRIHFYKTFNGGLHALFLQKYGITPIEYSDFNRTVLFQIEDNELFNDFIIHLDLVINSHVEANYHHEDYNLLALIHKFTFYSSTNRVETHENKGLLISLIDTHLNDLYKSQKKQLVSFLKEHQVNYSYSANYPALIEVHQISDLQLKLIVDNFDIVKSITSTKTGKIRPSIAGPVREFGFTVRKTSNLPKVAVIDTGINRIEPLQELIIANYNLTSFPDNWDEEGHGTLVAGLVAFGDDFYLEEKEEYDAKAELINIKALHFSNDEINIPLLLDEIRKAKRDEGVRIFNMSLVIPNAKKYNSTYSRFAYQLDKLAYEEDVLIFISVGNFPNDSLKALKEDYPHADHDYPNFFYCLGTESDSHVCEDTNICVPAESLNNISVGAIAGNLEENDNSDVTPSSLYPAYYTRKFNLDFNQKVNGLLLNINARNNNLNKPDFIMEGGDLFEYSAGIQILRSPLSDTEKYYGRNCGTSLATPLLTSYAAEILREYPLIRTQSVKAILINGASYHKKSDLPHFANHSEDLIKKLVGFGRPEKEKLLATDDHSILYLIEGEIKLEEIITYPIKIPSYLLRNGNKLQFDISLAYSFNPVEDNHLSYLPLHISFCVVKNLGVQQVATTTKSIYGIKNSFGWSEDHFGIDNKIFSNSQRKSYRLQPADIVNAEGAVAIAVRCLAKNDFIDKLKDKAHPFSLAIRISEIIINENVGNINLHNEMLKINQYSEIENNIDLSLEAEA